MIGLGVVDVVLSSRSRSIVVRKIIPAKELGRSRRVTNFELQRRYRTDVAMPSLRGGVCYHQASCVRTSRNHRNHMIFISPCTLTLKECALDGIYQFDIFLAL